MRVYFGRTYILGSINIRLMTEIYLILVDRGSIFAAKYGVIPNNYTAKYGVIPNNYTWTLNSGLYNFVMVFSL